VEGGRKGVTRRSSVEYASSDRPGGPIRRRGNGADQQGTQRAGPGEVKLRWPSPARTRLRWARAGARRPIRPGRWQTSRSGMAKAHREERPEAGRDRGLASGGWAACTMGPVAAGGGPNGGRREILARVLAGASFRFPLEPPEEIRTRPPSETGGPWSSRAGSRWPSLRRFTVGSRPEPSVGSVHVGCFSSRADRYARLSLSFSTSWPRPSGPEAARGRTSLVRLLEDPVRLRHLGSCGDDLSATGRRSTRSRLSARRRSRPSSEGPFERSVEQLVGDLEDLRGIGLSIDSNSSLSFAATLRRSSDRRRESEDSDRNPRASGESRAARGPRPRRPGKRTADSCGRARSTGPDLRAQPFRITWAWS